MSHPWSISGSAAPQGWKEYWADTKLWNWGTLLKVSPEVTTFKVSFVGFEPGILKVSPKITDPGEPGSDTFGAAEPTANTADGLRLASSIEPGSVSVKSNGMRLQENVDYTVDYDAGIVTVTNAAYLKADQLLQIDYDSRPERGQSPIR